MLRQQLSQRLKTVMREDRKHSVGTIRLILAAVKDRDIAARSDGNNEGIDDTQILSLLQSMIRQRHESITMYEQGGRAELAEREREEIGIIADFLPRQLDEQEIEAVVKDVISELDAHCLKDMGRTMATLRNRYTGSMDFSKASGIAKALLG